MFQRSHNTPILSVASIHYSVTINGYCLKHKYKLLDQLIYQNDLFKPTNQNFVAGIRLHLYKLTIVMTNRSRPMMGPLINVVKVTLYNL